MKTIIKNASSWLEFECSLNPKDKYDIALCAASLL